MKLKVTEKEIEKAILRYLKTRADVYVWKQNTIGVYDPLKGTYRLPTSEFIIRGVADILGLLAPSGKLLAIEVKTPARCKNVSPDQVRFLEAINKHGGIAFVATSIEDVRSVLDGF